MLSGSSWGGKILLSITCGSSWTMFPPRSSSAIISSTSRWWNGAFNNRRNASCKCYWSASAVRARFKTYTSLQGGPRNRLQETWFGLTFQPLRSIGRDFPEFESTRRYIHETFRSKFCDIFCVSGHDSTWRLVGSTAVLLLGRWSFDHYILNWSETRMIKSGLWLSFVPVADKQKLDESALYATNLHIWVLWRMHCGFNKEARKNLCNCKWEEQSECKKNNKTRLISTFWGPSTRRTRCTCFN